jgi:2-oxo-4-hydroxy-4-carboxy-5-ureidoimidazoline decarboxylase
MTLNEFNQLSGKEAFNALFACCGSTTWANKMAESRPFSSIPELKGKADEIWSKTSESDWLEAFTHHPKIGDTESLKKKFAATAAWAASEQGAVNEATTETIGKLAQGNSDYEKKFGFIFIVCATGKSAEEMRTLLENRLPNNRAQELVIAAGEQHKITHLRIDKLFA